MKIHLLQIAFSMIKERGVGEKKGDEEKKTKSKSSITRDQTRDSKGT